jgi:hypothetical protein
MSQMRRDCAVQHTVVVRSAADWRKFFLPHKKLALDLTLMDEEGKLLSNIGSRRTEFEWFSVGTAFLNTNSPIYVMGTPTLVGGWQLEAVEGEAGLLLTIVERWPGPEIFKDGMRVKPYSLRIIPGDDVLAEPPTFTFPDVSKI